MDIEINRIALYKPSGRLGIRVKLSPKGTAHDSGEVSPRPIIRYAKDYTVGKSGFSLFVRTFIEDKKLVEKQLDTVAKTITEKQAKALYEDAHGNFIYLDNQVKEK